MKLLLRSIAIATMAILTTGCLETTVRIVVEKDGSGQLIFERLQDPTAAKGKAGNAKAVEDAKAAIKKMIAEEKDGLAKVFGKGVTCKSMEFVERKDGYFGFKALLDFKNLNSVIIPSDPEFGNHVPLKFTFKKNAVNTLTATIQKNRPNPFPISTEAEWETQLTRMGPAVKGVKVDITIEIKGTITETDAAFVDRKSSIVPMMRVDMEKMLADRANLKKALVAGGPDLVQLAKSSINGMQSQAPEKPITVQFK
jgi:hypothetical protein